MNISFYYYYYCYKILEKILGSDEELSDLLQMYEDGCDMDEIIEQMWFGHVDEEERYLQMLRNAVKVGAVSERDILNESPSKRKRRRK